MRLLVLLLLALTACGPDVEPTPTDAGAADAGVCVGPSLKCTDARAHADGGMR